jgi:hypothetical protein
MSAALDFYTRMAHHPELVLFVDALQRLCRNEHLRLAQACIDLQRQVASFRTAEECAADNQALRDVATLLEEGKL